MKQTKENHFKSIVEENGDQLKRICRYYNSDAEDQKDMYQEILVNVWKSLDNFRGDSKISTWLYRIALNTALTFNGKTYKRAKLFIDKDVQNLNILFDDDEVLLKEKREVELEMLYNELNQLSVVDKAMITLMLEGLSSREIADVIGLTEPNIRVKLHRIKEQLRAHLQPNENE